MKKTFLLLLLAFTFACDKDDDKKSNNPIDQLPPATQTGAGTFGCLVNGKPFVDNSGFFNCFYQFVEREYYFGIQAEDNVSNIKAIALGSLKKEIVIDEIIPLNLRVNNEFYALLDFNVLQQAGSTTEQEDGFIRFTRFTTNPNIVSATFEFTVTDPATGIVYEITEGRFDAKFTQ
ncbi:hypothetical protein ACI6PS_16060 [Flavobacterium sp. PLA-1-15]|uniref:hypothetical protein n=1 Tax=Flavobacterium sp. PLA-1-15 TaxID=3380533 RepID=UPI003B771EA5